MYMVWTYLCIYTFFLLNLGANTIWYLHFQVVCAKPSVYGLFIRFTPFMIYILSHQTLNIISYLSGNFCYFVQNYKFSISPSIAGVFSKVKKERQVLILVVLFYIFFGRMLSSTTPCSCYTPIFKMT